MISNLQILQTLLTKIQQKNYRVIQIYCKISNFLFSPASLVSELRCDKKRKKKCNAFLLCLTSFYYLNEWSDTKLVNTIFVKTAEAPQAALKINSYMVWLRSKWGLKLTYFITILLVKLISQSRHTQSKIAFNQ